MRDATHARHGSGHGPLLLFLPAMGVPASFYAPFCERLRGLGIEPEVIDLPGQGTSPLRARHGDDYGYREVVELLVPDALQQLAQRFPGRPCLLGGHSLGGQLAVLASGTLADRVHGLVLVAAGSAHWRTWPAGRRARAALAVHAISAMARVLPWYPGQRLGFGGDQARRFMRDWSHNARTGTYTLEGSDRSPEALRESLGDVTLPVLSLSVQGDPVAPPGATDALCRLLPAARLRSVTVPGVTADAPWRRHFSWARRAGGVEPVLARWLADALPDDPSGALRSPSSRIQGDLRHVMA
ncbi:MAG TPA: alpha/beta fold hydrolase [Rhizobacter sp.]